MSATSVGSVDFNFREEHFNIMISKLIDICLGFDRRKLGPVGMKAFEIADVTPEEFKEIIKRTFNIKLNAQELGALVKYFDHVGSGLVNCPTFLKDFNQMRLRLERFKGKPNEAEFVKELQHQLKESYVQRIERRSVAEGKVPRPWIKGSIMAPKRLVRNPRPPPENAMQKLKRRLLAGNQSGRMDLSTSYLLVCSYRDAEKESQPQAQLPISSNPLENEDGDDDKTKTREEPAIDSALLPGTVTLGTSAANGFSIAGDGRFFILTAIPDEVYKFPHLTELWLCNNELKSCPESISVLSNLRLLSLQGCGLKDLPLSIGDLHELQTLYLQNNDLEALPTTFSKLVALTEIDLSYNVLKAIPDPVYQMRSLSRLNVSFNYIETLSSDLKDLRSLMLLNVEGNLLKDDTPPVVLQKMHWVSVIGCTLPKAPLAATVFAVDEAEEKLMLGMLRQRARRRVGLVSAKTKNNGSTVLTSSSVSTK